MEQWIEKNRKILFFISVGICFLAIFVFNMLTPMMSDDIPYMLKAREANNLWDLVLQEVEHHGFHSGRNVAHLILRIFLCGSKYIFNFFNAVVFMILSLEIYWNASARKRYDFGLFILVQILMWTSAVSFDETILWEDGSCNYLWGAMFIMTFISVYRKVLKDDKQLAQLSKCKQILLSVGIFLLGVIAGWCNENTSGGCFLLAVIFLILSWKEISGKPWLFTGLAGIIVGMIFMLSSPGNWARDAFDEETESYSGLVGLLSHFLKITVSIKRIFGILIIIFVALMVIMYLKKCVWKDISVPLVWAAGALCTSYVLVFITEQMDRSHFGAGIFFITAIISAIAYVCASSEYKPIEWIRITTIIVSVLWLCSTWIENSANLARIYRDCAQREKIAQEQLAAGEDELYLPMVHPQFDNPYTNVYKVEITEDPEYWVNLYYEDLYKVDTVIGVDRETWDEEYAPMYGG